MQAAQWWEDYELDTEARYALELDARRRAELSEPQRQWLDAYRRDHDYPLAGDSCFEYRRDADLGVPLEEDVNLGYAWHEAFRGGLSVGCSWSFCVSQVLDERGWHLGWKSKLSGLSEVLEAFGEHPEPGLDEPLGPFPTADEAEWALRRRMLAALVRVSEAAAAAHPPAAAAFEKRADFYELRF